MIPALNDWTYTPDERLGGGGYAQVYRARPARPSKKGYAIKVLDNPHYANTFEAEVRIMQCLRGCPHTPALVAYGRNPAGRLCIVIEMISGVRLDRHVQQHGPLSPIQARRLLAQVLEVLAFAHAREVLHKDLKASNILMDGNRFFILDWGVSEQKGDGRQENIRAKQDSVAPECYWGRHDYATDFYALGWLLVYALSGARPYHFADIAEANYRVAAHCLERPCIPSVIGGPWRQLVANWIQKKADRRLVGYDPDTLLKQARTATVDDWEGMTFRQLRHECSFLRRAARNGVPYAQYELALALIQEKRLREAHFWLKRAALQGYARAAWQMARQLANDHVSQSRHWLEMASAAGHPAAQYHLARHYLKAHDTQQGVALLYHAAANGHGPSQLALCEHLAQTPGGAEEAAIWRRRAADRGKTPPCRPGEASRPPALSGAVYPSERPIGPWRVVEANTLEALDAYAQAWDDLVTDCPAAYPSQTCCWLRAFYAHKLEPRERMVCLLAFQGPTLVGVLPLVGGGRLFGLGYSRNHYRVPYADYHTVRVDGLVQPGHEGAWEAFMAHLSRAGPEAPIVRLRKLPDTSPTLMYFRQGGRRLQLLERVSGAEHRTHLPGEYASYLADLNKKFRRTLERQARRLQERAMVRFRLRESSRSVGENLAHFMAVENSGWKGTKNTSIQALPGDPPLYRAGAECFTARGWMEWNFLEADGQTIAGQYAVRFHRTLFLWKVGYREDYAHCAPSHLLLARVIENALRHGDVETINFMARRTWLRVWHVTAYPLRNLIVFPRGEGFAPLIDAAVKRGYVLNT